MIRSFSCIAKVVDTNDTAAVCSVVGGASGGYCSLLQNIYFISWKIASVSGPKSS